MSDWVDLIQRVGFPIAVATAALLFIGVTLHAELKYQSRTLMEIKEIIAGRVEIFSKLDNRLSDVERALTKYSELLSRFIETEPFRVRNKN